ncbi:MAG: polysaccharide biosynthesis protein, partial [bacterium]
HIPDDYKTYPVNFGDPVFEKIVRREGPFDIIANFAAHKHVRSEKDHYSIEAMIDNNVIRAGRLLALLSEAPPAHFFCVSTDKAANPVNVMGASKKLMEEVILAYSAVMPVTTARFANVAFSNGSLLAGFIERLMKR